MVDLDRRAVLRFGALFLPAANAACLRVGPGFGELGLAYLRERLPPDSRSWGWDPVAYNKDRGRRGFIPKEYMAKIDAEDGVPMHLGKHLPYIPTNLPKERWVDGFVPIMFGNPTRGYAKHPQARRGEGTPEGHFYDWIRIALDGSPSSQVETEFDEWPTPTQDVNGRILALEGNDPTIDEGRNTVYLCELPKEAKPGSVLRIWAHCLGHGEYVDFIELT